MKRRSGRLVDEDGNPRHLDRFGPLLVLTVVTVVALSLVDLVDPDGPAWTKVAATAVSLISGLTLFLALRASGTGRIWRRYAELYIVVASVVTMATLVLDLATDGEVASVAGSGGSLIWVAVAATAPVAIVGRLLRHERVTTRTMFGAISAYLLIAVAFAYLFIYVDGLRDATFFTQGDQPSTAFMYFSLVTITTLGYGDLTPATELGRMVSTTEAVIGQVYLVTFVALFVGLLINQRAQERNG